MQRSGTVAGLNSGLKQKMGLAANGENRVFDSYINKPMKAISGTVDMTDGNSPSQGNDFDAQKLPKLNRFNVRSLDESARDGLITPDRRSGINKSVSQASFHRGLNSKSVQKIQGLESSNNPQDAF